MLVTHVSLLFFFQEQALTTFNFLNQEARYVAGAFIPPQYVSEFETEGVMGLGVSKVTNKYIYLLWLIAVCIYRYVITLRLWSKYDVGHYSRFALRILEITSCMTSHYCCYVPPLYCMQPFNLTFWLIWYSTKRAYVIMICPSCIVVGVVGISIVSICAQPS